MLAPKYKEHILKGVPVLTGTWLNWPRHSPLSLVLNGKTLCSEQVVSTLHINMQTRHLCGLTFLAFSQYHRAGACILSEVCSSFAHCKVGEDDNHLSLEEDNALWPGRK